jgi:hypothetical protein
VVKIDPGATPTARPGALGAGFISTVSACSVTPAASPRSETTPSRTPAPHNGVDGGAGLVKVLQDENLKRSQSERT